MKIKVLFTFLFLFASTAQMVSAAQTIDQSHAEFSALLAKNVKWLAQKKGGLGVATKVNYAGLKNERDALKKYTRNLASVSNAEFAQWPISDRRAFLINAYNAYTLELILTKYPKLKSIKDLGGIISSPWSKVEFQLLGQKRSLDDIEHTLLRGAKDFNDPRIHFAVNCASIGCPALRPEAYVGDRLEAQLEDQTQRFLQDRSRNRFDRASQTLLLSKIFDWYRGDFEKGHLGAKTLPDFIKRYGTNLALTPAQLRQLQDEEITIDFLDYNWSLNQ